MSRKFDGFDDNIVIPSGVALASGSAVSVHFWTLILTGAEDFSIPFSIGGLDNPNRCQAHVPYSDKALYWDSGDFTSGRISTDFTSYMDKVTAVGLTSSGSANTFKGIYLNGSLVTSAASSSTRSAVSGGTICGGISGLGNPYNGRVGEFAVWNVVLSAAEFAALGKGVTPNRVRPGALVCYFPIWGVASPEPELTGKGNGAVTGATLAQHPPVGGYA